MQDDTKARFDPRNAGGTRGGVGQFFLGLALMAAGLYFFLRSVEVTTGFAWGSPFFVAYGHGVPPGRCSCRLASASR